MPRPIRAAYTIPYGAAFGAIRAGGKRTHQGTDYHAPQGTPIYGTGEGGKVIGIGYNGDAWLGLGHNITIQYPDGKTLDAHMRSRTPLVIGQAVGPNTLVGYVGLTGNAVNASPPGSHDHHQRWNRFGQLINPEAFYGTSLAGNTPTEIITDGILMALSDQQQTDLYNAVMQLKAQEIVDPGGYSWAHAANNNTQEIKDALLKPNEETKPYKPIDVLVSHVKAILAEVKPAADAPVVSGPALEIDYDRIASLVADKLAARLAS